MSSPLAARRTVAFAPAFPPAAPRRSWRRRGWIVARRLRRWGEYWEVATVIAAVTFAGWFAPLTYHTFGLIYLLVVVSLSLRVGRWPVLGAAVLSALAWDFVFIPPRLSFAALAPDDALLLGTYLVVALVAGQLTARIRVGYAARLALLVERDRLRAAREREALLAESDRLHRTLLDSVSHELKTPIAVLRSAITKLPAAEPEKRERLTAEIRTAVLRLDRLIGDLLNQTRLEAGAVRPHPDWCDPNDLVGAALRNVGESLAGRPVHLDLPANAPLVWADAVLAEQALSNLLRNAAQHTPAGTEIAVAIAPDTGALSVSDRGPGLPPDFATALFRKFRRGAGAPAGGVGLGLTIARGFMQAQGGDVAAGNRSGGGACFTVRFARTMPADTLPPDER